VFSGNESLGMIGSLKSDSLSSENISSTNEVSILPIPNSNKQLTFTSTPNGHHHNNHNNSHNNHPSLGSLIIQPILRQSLAMQDVNITSRSSQSTPSPSTTTLNIESHEGMHFNPIVKMEVQDDDDENSSANGEDTKAVSGNFNYVGEYIAAELNKLPLRHAFILKNILIRDVLEFGEKIMLAQEKQ
jgi:hypothetical protein